jgi:hypothetical protein
MSTSISYLRKRLRDIGRLDLLEGAEAGHFSFHAAAIDAGLIKQPAIIGNGSQNASKRTAYAIWKATKSSPLDGPTPLTAPDMPDLQAALAELEEAQKPAPPRDRGLDDDEKGIVRTPGGPQATPFPAHPAIPCTSCNHVQAAAALREVIDGYLAACRGEPHQTGSTLPRACCQRLLRRRPDIRAMIA